MKVNSVFLGLLSGILSGIFLPAIAQVTSDGTTNTIVNQSGNNFNILNGINKGNNLFHSFSNFSIPTGGSAKFDLTNTPNITTIFSRVTGGNVSNIDGLISTLNGNNPVSLFLMNPNGIIFGQNAKLDIGGSFVATTANSIKFSDGTEFSAVNPTAKPLLTMSVPIGLQMGQNPSNIQVNHSGHLLNAPFLGLLNRGSTPTGLSVQTGKSLALIGGNISLAGGILNAPNGQVELGAVASPGLVTFNTNSLGLTFDYGNIAQFGNIQLGRQSLVEASNTGRIRLMGNNVSLNDASLLLLENRSTQPAIGIEINATGTMEMVGSTPNATLNNGEIRSGIISHTRSSGLGGNITVNANRIIGRDNGGELRSLTFGSANSGNITFNANEIILRGGDKISSTVSIRTLGTGNGGRLTVNTGRLILQGGGLISNVNNGSGNAGDVLINATESVVIGPNKIFATVIGSSAVSARGNAGKVAINTPRLTIQGGGLISSSTYGEGNAGVITLNVSESLEMSGVGLNTATQRIEPTTIRTAGILLPQANRDALRLPDQVTGSAGGIIINTPNLEITDNALISVSHDSVGNAGKIEINADTVRLNTQGKITATTASGEGGNISLNLRESLLMGNSSVINTEAGGTGNGGNITLNSPIILGLENSDIIANAVGGRGGNIDITTKGIIGLEFSDTLTPRKELNNDITASSQFNINGNVQINNIGVDPNSGLVELPTSITDPSQQIATGCSNNTGSSFVATGRGGIPQNPNQDVRSERTWSDVRDLSAYRQNNTVTAQIPETPEVLVQATGWRLDASGKVELIADKPSTQVQQPLTCAAVPKS